MQFPFWKATQSNTNRHATRHHFTFPHNNQPNYLAGCPDHKLESHLKLQTMQSEFFCILDSYFFCSDKYALHSHLILGEGGYFDSQTTDTQFFGSPDPYPTVLHQDITPHGLHPAAEDGVNTVPAGVIKLPVTLAPEVHSTADTGSADRRLYGPKEKWDWLDG